MMLYTVHNLCTHRRAQTYLFPHCISYSMYSVVGALTFSWKHFASPASRGYESDRIIRSLYNFTVSLSVLSFTFPLLHYLVCLILAGDMDYNWLDHTSWHSSEASPMSLVRHVEPYHLVSFIISHFLCFIYTFACFLFCILFFIPHL